MKRTILIAASLIATLCSCTCTSYNEKFNESAHRVDAGKDSTLLRSVVADPWIFYGDGPFTLDLMAEGIEDGELETLTLIRDTTLMKAVKDTAYCGKASFEAHHAKYQLGKLTPGFYQASFKGTTFNIGVNPERISSPADKQADFDEFWSNTLAELAAVEMEPELTLVPEWSNDTRRTYIVKVRSLGGELMGGILTEPVAPGKYPVSIEYMGYGAGTYYHHPDENPSRVDFLVSVRGQGIFKTQDGGWFEQGMTSKEEYYYRGAFCDVVRAIDFLCSRESVDTSRMFAWGDSQGGAFTWVSASLDHRVRAIAPSVPFLSDYPDYAKIVWWPMWELFAEVDKAGLDRNEVMKMMSYFDIKNLTDRITCPVYMAFGLQDPTCPGHTNFAGFNAVKTEKRYLCVVTCGHAMWAEPLWQAERRAFFEGFLN